MRIIPNKNRLKIIENSDESIYASKSHYDLIHVVRDLCDDYAYRYCSIHGAVRGGELNIGDQALLSTVPVELAQQIKESQNPKRTPLNHRMGISSLPFEWRTDNEVATEDERWFSELLDAGRINSVIVIPVHDAYQNRGAVVFFGRRDPVSVLELAALSYLAKSLFQHVRALVTLPINPSLSEREHQCLQWTAQGKTSSEIATILGISTHTVNHYLSGISARIGAVNRTQAVAIGLRNGWVQ